MKYRKRGRPRVEREGKDFGTPELQKKRQEYVTEEVLDRYLRLNIINIEQHWCGVHFRWLYTKLYGLPSARAISFNEKGRSCAYEHPLKLQSYYDEYAEVECRLSEVWAKRMVQEVAIFNKDILAAKKNIHAPLIYDKIWLKEQFINGMNVMVKHWCR